MELLLLLLQLLLLPLHEVRIVVIGDPESPLPIRGPCLALESVVAAESCERAFVVIL